MSYTTNGYYSFIQAFPRHLTIYHLLSLHWQNTQIHLHEPHFSPSSKNALVIFCLIPFTATQMLIHRKLPFILVRKALLCW